MGTTRPKLAGALLIALVALVISPAPGGAAPGEQPVSDPVPFPAEDDQRDAAVASAGSSSLVVWTDTRPRDTSEKIYAARVTNGGAVPDVGGIRVDGDDGALGIDPAVAFNGTDYLVIWTELGPSTDIYGRRVSVKGQLLGEPFSISSAGGAQIRPTITRAAGTWFVAWTDLRGPSSDIYGTRVGANGTVLDPAGIAITRAVGEQDYPAVTWDGQHRVVAWRDDRNTATSGFDVYAARVSTSGTVLDPAGIPVTTAMGDQFEPATASSGPSSLIVWRDQRNGFDSDIYGARVSRAGSVLDPAGRPVSTASSTQHGAQVAWDGTAYLAVWLGDLDGNGASFGRRLGGDARPLGSGKILHPGPFVKGARSPATSDGFLVVWNPSDVIGRRVGPLGSPIGAVFDISIAAARQDQPDIAFDGTNHLVVWQERFGVYAARVGPDGRSLDPGGIVVSASADGLARRHPSVAFDGTRYLVAWSDSRSGVGPDIFTARVSTKGIVLDPQGIPLTSGGKTIEPPDVAAVGDNFLVVWTDRRRGNAERDVFGGRVSSTTGRALDPSGIPISAGPDGQLFPSVASAGNRALVVWEDHLGFDPFNSSFDVDIAGARVTATGTVLDPTGIAISQADNAQTDPVVAFDGTRYLVAWSDGRDDGGVYASRVRADGTVLDPSGIAVAITTGVLEPVVSANGRFLVAWRRNQTDDDDIYGTTLDGAGVVAHPGGRPIVATDEDDEGPALAPSADRGRFRLASSHFTPEPPVGATRVYTRSVAPK